KMSRLATYAGTGSTTTPPTTERANARGRRTIGGSPIRCQTRGAATGATRGAKPPQGCRANWHCRAIPKVDWGDSSFGSFLRTLLERFLQLGDIRIAKLGIFHEVQHHRRESAAEDALQKGGAFLAHAFFAAEARRIDVHLALAPGVQNALFHEAREEGIDRL